jgi:glycosyltransferase involved in cell wall biosynthesis
MRFLFVSEFLPKWNSGAEGSLLSIGEALEKRGNRVDYLWKDVNHGYLLHPRFHEYFALPEKQLARVDRVLAETKYDVVVISQPYSYLIFERLTSKYPGTVFLNRTHGWEHRLAETSDHLKWRKTSALTQPLRNLSGRPLIRACERTARSCTGLIAASHRCSDFIKTRYDLPAKPIAVIPYGVEQSLIGLNGKDKSRSAPKLLFVGQYLPVKGSTVLEKELPNIAGDYPGTEVTFIVPDDAIATVRARFGPFFGDRLAIRGWMSREKLTGIYREHDILLFPSFFEGFGKVFLEGMAAGLCVVGFGEGGLPDIAMHGREALICNPGDSSGFRHLLDWALRDPDRTAAIGRRAREVAKRFTWDRHAVATENFCWQLKMGTAKEAIAS